jgi:hypothetical protein
MVDAQDVTGLPTNWRTPRRLTCVKTGGIACDRLGAGSILLRRELDMARYVARFMKNVLGDNGREVEICQCSIEIEAPCAADAAELAKARFCESEQVRDWSLHADRVHVIEAEFPS